MFFSFVFIALFRYGVLMEAPIELDILGRKRGDACWIKSGKARIQRYVVIV